MEKNNRTPVTQADLEAERKIREFAVATHPELALCGEEYGGCPQDAPLKFIIDPIDGTQNFIRGIPFFASLLAIEEKGRIIAGLVSAPATRERWWASTGSGSFYNDTPIYVTKGNKLEESQCFHSSMFGQEALGAPSGFLPLLAKTKRQRGMGDYYAHVLVAMGCGEFAVDFNLNVWDMAPLKIIVEEAGGKVTDSLGKDTIYTHTIISSNGLLHDTVVRVLNQ